MRTRNTKDRAVSGIVLDELHAQAKWLCQTTGYTVEVGIRFSLTEAGVLRVPQMFARAAEGAPDGSAGDEVHEQHWQYPTDSFKTMEALLMHLLWRLEDYLEHAA